MALLPKILIPCFTVAILASVSEIFAQTVKFPSFILPEQRSIRVRDVEELPRAPLPDFPPPPTIDQLPLALPKRPMTLNEILRMALENSEVVRFVSGAVAGSSGQTIYDVAISNTAIDEQNASFDPALTAGNSWNRFEPASVFPNVSGQRTDSFDFDFGLNKRSLTGADIFLGARTSPSEVRFGTPFLNPVNPSSLQMNINQPLLQGGGTDVNRVPLILARIDTERSFFRFKDSMQELVRGVIAAYWNLVFARTDRWARQRQLAQAQFAFELAKAEYENGIIDLGDFSQPRVSVANFRAASIAADARVLQNEAALRNVLGLAPYGTHEIVPVTPPNEQQLKIEWQRLVDLTEQRRPEIIELKLVLEAAQQLLRQRQNIAMPRVDAQALYRWNGISGMTSTGNRLSSYPGQFADWSLGVNFSVPLGLRRERAALRRQELIIARDRANLQQELHNMLHILALHYRNLALYYAQYQAFHETRIAANDNLNEQLLRFRAGDVNYISLLLAINDWGNAISSEAQSLTQYNIELATLERQSGTILETHDVRFFEERDSFIGPLGPWHDPVQYPSRLRPEANIERYPGGDRPSEESFDLKNPLEILIEPPNGEAQEMQPRVLPAPPMVLPKP